MSRRPPHLNAARRRARKQQLAARDGAHCYYCRRPFLDLREATADHIAPVSVWRSWSVSSLVLACRSCNEAKADRFPLLLALLLSSTPVNDASTPVDTEGGVTALISVTARVTPGVTAQIDADSVPVDRTADGGSTPVNAGATPVNLLAVWCLLARLAHAHQSVFTAVWSADSSDGESTPDLYESTCHGRRTRRPSARPVCLRTTRPVRKCSGPTGEAVPA
ncbi:HNH endonuclease signature motif containing protein [Streptomyces sp. NPDC005485]|uniref:HNH endonuclease n=1 Tax=Streptomyces sp. NPDC005485 TaxID=3155591 RepID=UPI0033BEE92D